MYLFTSALLLESKLDKSKQKEICLIDHNIDNS